ncbi:site-2 protease family protein [Candidatus Uhrbacteria bacterium]|nr:site-2 protease family protein [Candidatus Uhrbacteria bacterium]
MLSVLIFLLILSALVLFHELGHYVLARLFGVKADEFGFGFPPRVLGFVNVNGKWKRVGRTDRTRYANTVWSLNWLPLGGFVRLKGEAGEDGKDPDSLLAKNGWQKFAILAAGVTMNWLFAAVVFSAGFMIGVPAVTEGLPPTAIVTDPRVQIMEVVPSSAAAKAGLKAGDEIVTVEGQRITDAATAQSLLLQHTTSGEEITLEIKRDGKMEALLAMPEYLAALDRPGLGVALADTATVRFPAWLAVGEGITMTARYTWMIISGFFGLIGSLFIGKPSAELSGPVGIAVMTGGIVAQGKWAVAQFAAILSLNLAVINFLPIPALDGGRATFVLIEAIRRKKNNGRTEAMVHQIGFITLIIIVLLVTLQDLRRYGGTIWQGIVGLFGG